MDTICSLCVASYTPNRWNNSCSVSIVFIFLHIYPTWTSIFYHKNKHHGHIKTIMSLEYVLCSSWHVHEHISDRTWAQSVLTIVLKWAYFERNLFLTILHYVLLFLLFFFCLHFCFPSLWTLLWPVTSLTGGSHEVAKGPLADNWNEAEW